MTNLPVIRVTEDEQRELLTTFPTGWHACELADVVEEVTSGDWGTEQDDNALVASCVLRGTDFRVASIGITDGAPVRFLKPGSIHRREVRTGDLLVEMSGGSKDQPTGRIVLITERIVDSSAIPVTFSNFVKRLRLFPSCDSEYFSLYWESLYQAGVTRVYEKRTTGIRNFKLNDFLKNEMILLPPPPEQRAIAHVLRSVQQAKESTEAVIAATLELRKSLMRHLFTYGPVPVDQAQQVPLKETEIGSVPESWKLARLGDVARTTSGGTPSRKVASFYHGNIPWVKSGELMDGVIAHTEEHITPEAIEQSNAKVFPEGTLLVAMYGATAGRTAILAIPASTNQAVCAVFPVDYSFLPNYLRHYLAYRREALLAERYGGAQPNLSQTIIRQLRIALPSLLEQETIATILDSVEQKVGSESKRLRALDSLFHSLLHHLMTGKIRAADIEPILEEVH